MEPCQTTTSLEGTHSYSENVSNFSQLIMSVCDGATKLQNIHFWCQISRFNLINKSPLCGIIVYD
uniref:Uncharacterized protein n=1 Tax=Anguilla anguilla TaxID=7936 RepID=A0A0E9WN85_ANGAN